MKKFSLVLSLITLMLAVTFNVSAPLVLAEEKGESALEFIEQALEEKDTDVVSELKKQKQNYQARLQNEQDKKKRAQLLELVENTQKLLDDYTEKKEGVQAVSVSQKSIYSDLDIFFYENSVSACIAYFYANEYYLSAELLTHARYNRVQNSLYSPINIDILELSDEFNSVCDSDEAYGTGEFVKYGDVKDMDLFYSIHNFCYAKFQTGEVVTVYDNYDFVFDGGYDFIDDIPIKVMYLAQEKRVIVPFYTVIETRLSGTEKGRDNEAYPRIAYANGEYHLYKSECSCDCFAEHVDGRREDGAAHADWNNDGICDGCGAVVGEVVLPQEEQSWFDEVVATVTDFFVGLGAGCASSVGGCISSVSALIVGGLVLKKKKEN